MAGGRKPKHDYNDEMFLLEIEGMARDGFDDKQIAEKLGLATDYFYSLKGQYPQLSKALTRGRRPLEVLVENSLFSRARGMKLSKITKTRKQVINSVTGKIETLFDETEESIELAPDVKAQELWLRNRKSDKWNTKQGVDHTTNGKDVNAAPLLFMSASELDPEQLEAYIKKNLDSEDVSDND